MATGTHIVLYLRLRSPHSKQALSGGYSKDDTTYDLSYLLSGPSWEKSADLVFISPVVGEREPSTDHDWSDCVLRVGVSIPEPRDYSLLEEFGPEENLWRGKRLCLSFLVKSSFLLKKM